MLQAVSELSCTLGRLAPRLLPAGAALAPALRAGFASGSDQPGSSASGGRPLSWDAKVARLRSSLSDAELLQNSMSDASYDPTGRRVARASSIADPEYFMHNSMSDGLYEVRRVSRARMAGQGFGARRSPMVLQRIIARSSVRDPEPLHDSYSAQDYPPRTSS